MHDRTALSGDKLHSRQKSYKSDVYKQLKCLKVAIEVAETMCSGKTFNV